MYLSKVYQLAGAIKLLLTRVVLVFATEHKNKKVNYNKLVSCTYNFEVQLFGWHNNLNLTQYTDK